MEKKQPIIHITKLNIIFHVFAWILFLINQLTNLRFLGLWTIWNLSGLFLVLLVVPICILISIICICTTFKKKFNSAKEKKDFFITILVTLITMFLEVCCLTIPEMTTWA